MQLTAITNTPAVQRTWQLMPRITVVLLILLIAYTIAQLVWLLMPTPPEPVMPPPKAPASISQTGIKQPSPIDLASEVASTNLFGKAEKKTLVTPTDAPETQLNLKLLGVYATPDAESGYAIIASGGSKEKFYSAGAKLPGNSILASVYPDRVILERAGQFETLRLEKTQGTGGPIYSAPQSNRKSGGIRGNKQSSSSNADGSSGTRSIAEMRKELLKNPAQLNELVDAQPAQKNGKFAGFRIMAKKKHPLFDALGLQSGDIITKFNGINIDSPAKGLEILKKLTTARKVDVVVDRDGQEVQLNHSL